MTSRERVLNYLNGQTVDRIPNFSLVMQIIGRYSNIPYDECVQNYEKFCKANYDFCKEFNIDVLSAISDPMREASAYGTKISFPEDGVPHASKPLLNEFEDWKNLEHFDSLTKERTLDRIEAVKYFKTNHPDYAICGWVEGVVGEACDLRDINNFMVDIMVEEAEDVHEFLTFVCDQQIEFALKQIEAGADIIGIGDAATSLISPELFKEFALPYQKRLIEAIHEKGCKTKLHICGDTTHHLEMLALTKTDILDIDYPVNISYASKVFESTDTVLCGNFNPTQILLEGDVNKVKETIHASYAESNGRFIVAPGCEVPRNTSYENVMAIHEALVELGEK